MLGGGGVEGGNLVTGRSKKQNGVQDQVQSLNFVSTAPGFVN